MNEWMNERNKFWDICWFFVRFLGSVVASFVRRKSFAKYIHIYGWSSHVNIYSMTWHMTVFCRIDIHIVDFSCWANMLRRRDVYTNANVFGNFAWVFPYANLKTSHTFYHFIHNLNKGDIFLKNVCPLNFQLENYFKIFIANELLMERVRECVS